MDQQVERLTNGDRLSLERQREWLLGHYQEDAARSYEPFAAKLMLIDTILKNGWLRRDETWKLQSLGVAFGDALEQYMGLEWVVIVDEYGRDIAMHDSKSSAKVFPLTIISKRVEEGQVVDVVELFTALCNKVSDLRAKLA